MANLFERLKDTVASDLDRLFERKDEKKSIGMLNQYVKQCERETEKMKQLLERHYHLKEAFEQEKKEAKALYEKRAYQVGVASKAGEVELYDFALAEMNQYEGRAARLEEMVEKTERQLADLETKYMKMKHKLKDMHIKRLIIMGRENVANANARMHHVLGAEKTTDQAYTNFEKMENQVTKLEEKNRADYYRSTIDARIAELEKKAEKEEEDLIS